MANIPVEVTEKSPKMAPTLGVNDLVFQDHVPWYQKKNLRVLYGCLVPAALGVEMTSGYDGSVLNGLQAVKTWQTYFGHPDGAMLGLITASFSIGAVIALPFIPWFNDKYGRKPSILFGSLVAVVGTILQTAATNVAMLIVARALLGGGIPFAVSGASSLLAELSYPRERGVLTGLFNESWYVGAIVAAGITLGTHEMKSNWAWRIPSAFQVLPSLLQLVFIWFVPESPRWLIYKDRSEEAFDILVKYHAEGDRSDPMVMAEFVEIRETIRLETEGSKHTWVELLKTPALRHRIFIAMCVGVFVQWSGNGLVSYYLAKVLNSVGITSTRDQNVINLCLQCWNLCTGTAAAFASRYFGRRKQYLFSFIGMTVVYACWTGAGATYSNSGQKNQDAARAVVGLIFIYYGLYNIMHPLVYTYITEVFPFIYRAKGLAILQFMIRGASAFNQFVNPIGLHNLGWKYYIVYVVWLACEATIVFFTFPETKGLSLEQIATKFEGADARVGGLDPELAARKQSAEHLEDSKHVQ